MSKEEALDAISLLMAGKLYMQEFGWRQHGLGGTYTYFEPRHTPCCAWGAVSVGGAWCGLKVDGNGVAMTVLEHVIPGGNIPVWNDKPGRTKTQVLKKFDEAIAHLEAKL